MRRGRWRSATALVAGALWAAVPLVAGAAPDVAGVPVVVSSGGSPLSAGGSATPFTLRLPQGAACPGDSANDGYRVQSYMVPSTVRPADVTYDGLGPAPSEYGDWATFRQPLYDLSTSGFASAQTADAEAPGRPGPIVNLPQFSFGVYRPGELPAGRYHVGIACTRLNDVVRLWDTELVIAADADDEPAGVVWRVAGAAASAGGSKRSGAVTGAAIVAAAALVALVISRLVRHPRLRRSPPTLRTEDR